MTRLAQVIESVKDQHLDRVQLESYESELLDLYNKTLREQADILKARALFIHNCGEKTHARKVELWEISELGQKEIDINPDVKILPRILSSLKGRIYRLI